MEVASLIDTSDELPKTRLANSLKRLANSLKVKV
jgi:hypothetical protein